MARFSVGLMAGAMSLSLIGCSSTAQLAPTVTTAPPLAAPMPSKDTEIKIEKDHFTFQYNWPKEAASIPGLNAHFQTKSTDALMELEAAYSEDDRIQDVNDEYRPHYAAEYTWSFAATSGPLLSLSGNWYSYMGGAHGMYGVNDFVYDTANNAVISGPAMVGNAAAFHAAFDEEFCRLLDVEREKRRGAPVVRDDLFGDCINPLEQTVIWKSGKGSVQFDRVEIFVGPYAAGPYAEGSYGLNFPITAAMKAAIDPKYRDAFAVSGGNPYAVEDDQ